MTPTYSVLADDPRFRAIMPAGAYVPAADGSALLRAWDYCGFRFLSPDLARRLGAVVAVVRHSTEAADIIAEMGESGS
jgi:hypothetical protein